MIVSEEQTVNFAIRDDYDADLYSTKYMPAFSWSEAGYKGTKGGKCHYFYSTPHYNSVDAIPGFKVGYHRQGPLLDTEDFIVSAQGKEMKKRLPHLRKALTMQDGGLDRYALEASQKFVAKKLPGLDPNRVEVYMRCLYQNSPDLQMIVGTHPDDDRVYVACGFTGSGFQFAPAIAALIATAMGEAPPRDLPIASMASKFKLDRFS